MYSSVDLFCGAGGLTEGFRKAGFNCVFANDLDGKAVDTFRRNHAGTKVVCAPIEELSASEARLAAGLKRGDLDCLVGGSPCQGFSINAPERFLEDPRNSLFKHYVRFLAEFQPKYLVFENVPGMLSLEGGAIFRQIQREIACLGYDLSARVLFAPHYGVPQERYRLILLGSRVGLAPHHPFPTHAANRRANFTGGRSLTFSPNEIDETATHRHTTVYEALSDLPSLHSGSGSEVSSYDKHPVSSFSVELREGSDLLFHHVAPKLSAINLERLKYIKPGGSWRDIPPELLPKGMQRARRSDHTRRYGRLDPNGLASTVMTKIDPHWGAAFHYSDNRTLTPREAARLQTFPDRYIFEGTRGDQYRQVGNAVPVMLAFAVARSIVESLEGRSAPHLLFENIVCR